MVGDDGFEAPNFKFVLEHVPPLRGFNKSLHVTCLTVKKPIARLHVFQWASNSGKYPAWCLEPSGKCILSPFSSRYLVLLAMGSCYFMSHHSLFRKQRNAKHPALRRVRYIHISYI